MSSTQLQGLNIEHTNTAGLATIVAGAYMKATLNVGVGGTPKMVLINEKGVQKVGQHTTAFLTNVCGYYFAGALGMEDVKAAAEAEFPSDSHAEPAARRVILGKLENPGDLGSATLPLSVISQRVGWRERY